MWAGCAQGGKEGRDPLSPATGKDRPEASRRAMDDTDAKPTVSTAKQDAVVSGRDLGGGTLRTEGGVAKMGDRPTVAQREEQGAQDSTPDSGPKSQYGSCVTSRGRQGKTLGSLLEDVSA